LALAASFAIKAWIEGGVLAALILINVVIGTFQDLQAARTIASLNSLNSPTARVIRDGSSISIDASQIVPGDIIELKVGDVIPADARLLDSINLEVDEAALTGESLPARKEPDVILTGSGKSETNPDDDDDFDVGPGDRLNIVFKLELLRPRSVRMATNSASSSAMTQAEPPSWTCSLLALGNVGIGSGHSWASPSEPLFRENWPNYSWSSLELL
jgi:magnesium-transporting ATPase (P-type)